MKRGLKPATTFGDLDRSHIGTHIVPTSGTKWFPNVVAGFSPRSVRSDGRHHKGEKQNSVNEPPEYAHCESTSRSCVIQCLPDRDDESQ